MIEADRPWKDVPSDHLQALYAYLTDLQGMTEGDRQIRVFADRLALSNELRRRDESPGAA